MITIKIFLASSLTEFASQRKELEAFINSLNNIYVRKGIFFELIVCEDLSNAVQRERSQEMYNKEIRKSQYFYVIFGRKAGQFTVEEFDVALSCFREKGEPKLYTYFLVLPEGEQPDKSIIDFMHRLENELHYYHNKYTHIDSIKLNLMMELVRDPRVGGTLTLEDGEAHLDGTAVMSMDNIPLYSRNETVQKLIKEQKELEQEFVDLAGLGDSDAVQRLRLRNSARRNEIASQLHTLEMDVLGLCSRVEENRQSGKKLNWREVKALELADAGDYEAAKALLRDKQWQQEVSRAEETIDGAKEVIREFISGKKALIQMIRSTGVTKDNEPEIIDIYEYVCGLALKHLVEMGVLYDYAYFLYNQKKYARAAEFMESLCRIMAQTDMSLYQQAKCMNLLGNLYSKTSRYKEAETEHLRTRGIREKMAAENPAAYLSALAVSCNNLGTLYTYTSRYKEAETEYLRAKEIYEKLSGKNPAAYLSALAGSCNNLGNLYINTSRYKEAETEYLRAKEIHEQLAGNNPTAYLPDLAISCNNLGNLYGQTSRYKEAETEHLRAKEIREKLAEENPAAYLPELARSCNNLGNLYNNTSRYKEAETEYLRAKGIREKLAEENPAVYLPELAKSCNNLGNLYYNISQYKEAETEYLRAKGIREKLAEENPSAYLPELAASCNNLGNLYSKTSRYGEAETEHLRAKEIREKLAEENPAAYLPELAKSCNNLGSLYRNTSRYKEAETEYLRAKEIREKQAEENPAAYLPYLAVSCNNLGNLYTETARYKEAETEYLRAKEIREKLAKENPAAYLPDLAQTCFNLANLFYTTSVYTEAIEQLLRVKEICFKFAEKEPSVYLYKCIQACVFLSKLYRLTDKPEDAIKEAVLAKKCKDRLKQLK